MKRLICALLCICITAALFVSCVKNTGGESMTGSESENNETAGNSENESEVLEKLDFSLNKAILIYMGYNRNVGYESDEEYAVWSAVYFDKLIKAGVEEFIFCPTGTYNYLTANDGDSGIIKQETIDAMVQADIGSSIPADLTLIKSQYSEALEKIEQGKWRSLDYLVELYAKMTTVLLSCNPDAKIYYTFPETELHSLMDEFINPHYENLYKPLKEKIGAEIWERNVCGFYNCNEAVVQWYTGFDKENTADFGNPVVKHMRAMSDILHAEGKKFCWIPYYRDNSSALDAERISYIAQKTNIFDFVVIQPSYYFDEKHKIWLEKVEKSCELQLVVNSALQPIAGPENQFGTKIGPEIEIDSNVKNDDYKQRYEAYIDHYKKYQGTVPMVFYAGERLSAMSPFVLNYIAEFYLDDGE